jgi:hypothetical protein
MSELTPVDPAAGVARFDGRTLAKPEAPVTAAPDAGGPAMPGQTGPYVMEGLQWLTLPTATAPPAVNGFTATLSGASTVRLDLVRMAIDVAEPVTGAVTTDAPLELRLAGPWAKKVLVTVNGLPAKVKTTGGVLVLSLPAGTSQLAIG